MELTKWAPRTCTVGGHRFFDRVFDDFFAPTIKRENWLAEDQDWNLAVDIYAEGDHTVIKAELPGVDKKDIEVNLDGRTLTIKGKRESAKEIKEGKFQRREIVSGSLQRSFTLNEGVDPEKIKAEYKDGILKLEIPKLEESKTKKISVH